MPKKISSPKVALVYDRVNTPYGGAEHLLQAIGEIYPKAPLFTSVFSKKKAHWAQSFDVIPSFLQKIKFFRNHHQLITYLMPMAFESLNLDDFDIIISITSAEAKGIITKPHQLHICYLLTPTRYLYSHKKSYLKSKLILRLPLIHNCANIILKYLKWWDQAAIFRPDKIIAISSLVEARINKYYPIKFVDQIIYPPINTKLRVPTKKESISPFFLSISRLVDYKKVDLSIKATLATNNRLIIVGEGIQGNELRKISMNNFIERRKNEPIPKLLKRALNKNKTIIFTNNLPENDVNYLLTNCDALLMPGEEDFGITGLEASIFGKPVIVFYRSGVCELLTDGVDSIIIHKETEKELINALNKFKKTSFNKKIIESKVASRSTDKFKVKFEKMVNTSWNNHVKCLN
ncbi:MAG: glycosyltransferase [Pseudomonadales bacterium]|nr:glycosyltransferase [Pseudomonadales bacterium]